MNKVIFLYVDGVLNNVKHCSLLADKLLGREQYLELLKQMKGIPFDYRSCMLLQKLINKSKAYVVLSSTWRLNSEAINELKEYAGIEIVDRTPILDTTKGEEIQKYLDLNPHIKNYVIIDDDSDMLKKQMSHFVECNTINGFTKKEYKRALKILKVGGEDD
ncbi:MAG: hypothetical protein J6T10_24250 [Methanobrevibacter sp.]|nr:hypothetical protein [Methanobrevibacter sp.]